MRVIHVLWVLWLMAFLAMEFYAVGNPARGDTLTETVFKAMNTSFWVRVAVTVLVTWMWFHFAGLETLGEAWRRLDLGKWIGR